MKDVIQLAHIEQAAAFISYNDGFAMVSASSDWWRTGMTWHEFKDVLEQGTSVQIGDRRGIKVCTGFLPRVMPYFDVDVSKGTRTKRPGRPAIVLWEGDDGSAGESYELDWLKEGA